MSTVQEAAGKALEQREGVRASVVTFIKGMEPMLAEALPKHLSADRVTRLALTCIRKDKALATCTPESFAGSLLTAAAMGLEPGVNQEAYLVAYKGECTLIVGYQGFAKLFWNHPLAKHLDAQAVHENDEFDYAYGTKPFIHHKPAKANRGVVTHYYAVATLMSGAEAFTVLTADEAKQLRGGKIGTKGGIADPMHWMERKTALRQLVKLLPRSTEMNRALESDERPGSELHAELLAERTDAKQLESGAVVEGEWVDGPGEFGTDDQAVPE